MGESGMVNWVVVGIGDVTTKRVIPAIQAEPRSRLYGVVTRDLRKAAAYPEAKAWTTLEEALADPEVRAVYVASPVSRHQEQAIQGLRTGRAVLLEKPVAMNYGEAVSITEAAEQTGTLLGIAYFRRLFPKLIRAKELLAAGAIGTPVLAEACFHGWLESEERAWLRDPALAGGGPLYDTASHRIDALNFIVGPRSGRRAFVRIRFTAWVWMKRRPFPSFTVGVFRRRSMCAGTRASGGTNYGLPAQRARSC